MWCYEWLLALALQGLLALTTQQLAHPRDCASFSSHAATAQLGPHLVPRMMVSPVAASAPSAACTASGEPPPPPSLAAALPAAAVSPVGAAPACCCGRPCTCSCTMPSVRMYTPPISLPWCSSASPGGTACAPGQMCLCHLPSSHARRSWGSPTSDHHTCATLATELGASLPTQGRASPGRKVTRRSCLANLCNSRTGVWRSDGTRQHTATTSAAWEAAFTRSTCAGARR